jgi:hypothetical protein
MDYEENMVDETEAAEDEDFAAEDLTEEEEDTSESLDSLDGEEEAPAEEEQPRTQGTSEPGWFQKRWNKEVGKLTSQIREEVRNEYEQQFAPFKERLLEMDAKELVASGKIKDLEVAKDYLRMKGGMPSAPVQEAQQPREPNGQFAQKTSPAVEAKIDMLAEQANKVQAKTGIDVVAIMSSNEDIKNKIVNGEIDFYDVAEMASKEQSRRKPPAPTRSPNGASGQTAPNAIDTMSDEQFDRMERRIKEGARYALK